MKEIDYPFFSNEGLTGASSNYICNLAKEAYQDLEATLDNLRFYNSSIKLIGTDIEEITNYGATSTEGISEIIQEIAELKSLISWIREALKKKDALYKEIKEYVLDKWVEDNNLEPLKFPYLEKSMKESEYMDNMSVKDRNKYYELETLASTIGKAIHKDGSLSKAREKLVNALKNPIDTSIDGSNTIFSYKKETCSLKEVDNLFFELQAKHREVQAQLNGMKHQIEEACHADEIKKHEEYVKALEVYKVKQAEYMAKFTEFVDSRKQEILYLKIVIPNSLKPIYDKISNLGKKA